MTDLKEQLKKIKTSHPGIVKKFNQLTNIKVLGTYEEFKQEADNIVQEIEGLEGNLYNEDGKQAEIKEQLKELAKNRKKQEEQEMESYEERKKLLIKDIDKAIYAKDENLTSDQVAEINLRNKEWEGKIKGELYGMNNTRSIEHKFKELVNQAQYDKGLKRFLLNNYYMFFDRVKSLNTEIVDEEGAMSFITKEVENLKESNLSNKERALLTVRSVLKGMSFPASLDRVMIDNYMQRYK